jgi:mannose/fructose/N-acetylgalactosamine-specific phosphotransferase system component IIC
MTWQVLLTLLAGGVAALDATPVAQSLLSQPLVTSWVMGVIWGDPMLALRVGVVLQVFAASTLPVGARTPEDFATGGVIGAGVALALAGGAPYSVAQDACALVGVTIGLVAAVSSVPLLKWQRRRSEALSRWCEDALRHGDAGALARAHRAAVVLAFAVGVLFTAAFLAVGSWGLRPVIGHHSIRLSHAWNLVQPLWLGLGLAHLLNAFVQRRFTRAALFGFGLVAGWVWLVGRGS